MAVSICFNVQFVNILISVANGLNKGFLILSKFIHDRPSGSNDITDIDKQTTCMHLTQESSKSSR